MKTHNFIRLILYFTLGLTMTSCSVDDVTIEDHPIKVSFANQTQIMTQEMESIAIPIKLNPKAIINGYVTIELSGNASYDSDFTTVPPVVDNKLTISLLSNTSEFILVINRSEPITTEKIINLKLSNPSTGFSLGSAITSEVVLNADTSSINKLNFDTSAGFVCEDDSEGLIIGLNTTMMASDGSSAKIKLTIPQGIIYGIHFYTIPAAVLDEISLEFDQNSQQTHFKIIPINDHVFLGNYDIEFEIIEVNGHLEIGDSKFFRATIEDDDYLPQDLHTIAELKTNFSINQSDWFLPNDYYIEGIVTSDGNVIDDKSIYVQDQTSGILLRFSTPNTFQLGDKIKVNLKNASGRVVNGESRMDYLNQSQAVKYAENLVIQPEIITIEQLYTGDYQGKRVKLVDVYFENADGLMVFEGNHYIKQGNLSAVVTTYASAAFRNYTLPEGLISVSGIVGNWNYILPQKYSHDITY